MLDKRCKYKVRELQDFYLFIKYPRSHIYYAKFPGFQNKVISTGCMYIDAAYKKAYEIYGQLQTPLNNGSFIDRMFSVYKDDKKRTRDLKYVLKFLPDIKKPEQITSTRIVKLQQEILKTGVSGKTVNNYVYCLQKAYGVGFPEYVPLKYTSTYRKCFPISGFYGFYKKCQDRLHYLAFFTMTTGCRLGEISTCEPVTKNGRLYLKINGTKTENAVRTVPVLQETLDCIKYLKNGFRASCYKQSVIEAGKLCGFDESYIEDNNIVFHSFRKMYKTLLESCGVPNTFVEYYMGHSQTSKVNQLYFIGDAADDSEVYPKTIEALSRLL